MLANLVMVVGTAVLALLLPIRRKIKEWFLPRSMQERLHAVVDVDRAAKDLKVEERARAEGQQNRPASDQAEPDANERAIIEYFHAQWTELCGVVGERFSDLIRQLEALRERFDPSGLVACGNEAAEALDRHHAQSKLALAKARAAEQASHRDLKEFSCANGLSREAYTARPALVMAAGYVLAVILEGAINAWAFIPGSDLGVLGGTIQAIVVAGVNIGPAVMAGVLARNLLHINGARKAAGVLTVVCYLLFLAIYTLLVAHYRAALLVDSEQAAVQAVLRLIHTPFAIYDFHTLLLVICSVLFSVVSFTTSFRAADPYPGYSREQARWKKCKTAVEAEESAFIQGIDAVTQPMLDNVDRRSTEASRARETYRESVAVARNLVADYHYAASRLKSACSELVGRYRGINQRIRDTPPPAYFAVNKPEFLPNSGAVLFPFDLSALEHAEKTMASFSNDASDLREKADKVKQQIWALRASARSGSDVFFAEVEGLPEPRAATVAPVVSDLGEPAPTSTPVIVAARSPVVMPSVRKHGNGGDDAPASPYLGPH